MTDRSNPGLVARERIATPSADRLEPAPVVARPVIAAPLVATSFESEQTDSPRTVSEELNKELLRGAQERYRERQRNKGYAAAPERKPEPEPLVISNKYIPPSRDVTAQAGRGVTSSVFEFSGQPDQSGFDIVPSVATATASTDVRDSEPPMAVAADRAARPTEEAHPVWAELPDIDDAINSPESPAPAAGAQQRSPRRTSRSQAEGRSLVEHGPLREADIEAWSPVTEVAHANMRGPWPNITRCCQTCRDFRPAGNGQRGWCNNQWAFKHRRMVDADDRPCETSIGHWWVPGDEAWQGEFDVSALGQPTPLMDRWFGRSAGTETAAEAPVERRRRKASSW
jgi:hypothetical protein